MYIQDAVKQAISSNAKVYREKVNRDSGIKKMYIKPTNSYDACVVMILEDKKEVSSCRNWNPTADDLMSDDWELFTE